MRQLSFGTVDLALHRDYDPARDGDLVAYTRRLLAPILSGADSRGHAMIASFTHLFASPVGYGAGYYSYKWAECWTPTRSRGSVVKGSSAVRWDGSSGI